MCTEFNCTKHGRRSYKADEYQGTDVMGERENTGQPPNRPCTMHHELMRAGGSQGSSATVHHSRGGPAAENNTPVQHLVL